MAKDQAPSAPVAPRAGRNTGRGPQAKPPAQRAAAAEPSAPKKRVSPAEFFRQVRAEARKITWTSRKETWITSVMVFIMVVVAAVFFLVVDMAVSWGVSQVIKIGA